MDFGDFWMASPQIRHTCTHHACWASLCRIWSHLVAYLSKYSHMYLAWWSMDQLWPCATQSFEAHPTMDRGHNHGQGTQPWTGDTPMDRGHNYGDTTMDRGHNHGQGTHPWTGDTTMDRGHNHGQGTHPCVHYSRKQIFPLLNACHLKSVIILLIMEKTVSVEVENQQVYNNAWSFHLVSATLERFTLSIL